MDQDNFKKKLTSEEYRVLREKGTEPAFSGQYVNTKDEGIYKCKACGQKLFSSTAKFNSGTGWPSFDNPINLEHVVLKEDRALGLKRTEVICRKCGSHLGHVFDDGPTETGKRYCINSVCLDLEKA